MNMTSISSYCLIRQHKIIDEYGVYFEKQGALEDFLNEAYLRLAVNYPKFYKMDPLSRLGFLAGEIVFQKASIQSYPPSSRAVVLMNAHASLDTDIRYRKASRSIPSPALFVYTLPNIVTGELCIRHGLKGENAFFVTESFDPTLLWTYTSQVMAQDNTEVCLCGWIDVLGEEHDVFLYLTEKKRTGLGLPHTIQELKKIYQLEYGTVDGGSQKADH
jgi:hypothetical protein